MGRGVYGVILCDFVAVTAVAVGGRVVPWEGPKCLTSRAGGEGGARGLAGASRR